MNFLSIDFSTDVGSFFIKVKNKSFSKNLQSDKSNVDLIMKLMLDFLEENKLSLDELEAILVNIGPGSYSGLRGSLATAKGICLSKNLKLFAYDNFIWSGAKFFGKKDNIYSLLKVRDKYFFKKFEKNFSNPSEIKEINKDEIIKKFGDKFKVIPKSISKYFDKKILELNNIHIVNLDHNELEFLCLKGLLKKDLIKPLYLS